MLEGAGGEALDFVFLLFAVAVERVDGDFVGACDRAVFAFYGQAPLNPRLLSRSGFDFGIDELVKAVLRAHYADAFEHGDLRRGKPCAVCVFQRFAHIVEQSVQPLVEHLDGAALLEKYGVRGLKYYSFSHSVISGSAD